MVSTRGAKVKFFEGEKVLCYEPDPTKAKVLYESKVKDVVVNKDTRGRKNVEYLIHFRGWNSSWDRFVSEEFILKDTVENRQLQKDLAQKSKLQFGSYLYRKERKKQRKLNDRIASSEDGSCDSPTPMDYAITTSSDSDDEQDSSADDDVFPLAITEELKEVLEQDYHSIHERNMLHKLPAEPNVIGILEMYWKQYCNNQKGLVNNEKGNGRYNRSNSMNNGQRFKPENIQRRINICQEVLDGIRIYFDFTLMDVLLYNAERGQVECMQAHVLPVNKIKLETVKQETEDQEYAHLPNLDDEELLLPNDPDQQQQQPSQAQQPNQRPATRRRTLRSYRSLDTNSNGSSSMQSDTSTKSKAATSSGSIAAPDVGGGVVVSSSMIMKIPLWKPLPDYVYSQQPPPPSLVYGATHLTRLFVKLPELLVAVNLPEEKSKVLVSHLECFIDFLNEHKEWFDDSCYINPPSTT